MYLTTTPLFSAWNFARKIERQYAWHEESKGKETDFIPCTVVVGGSENIFFIENWEKMFTVVERVHKY